MESTQLNFEKVIFKELDHKFLLENWSEKNSTSKNWVSKNRIWRIQCLRNEFQKITILEIEPRKFDFQKSTFRKLNFETFKLKKIFNFLDFKKLYFIKVDFKKLYCQMSSKYADSSKFQNPFDWILRYQFWSKIRFTKSIIELSIFARFIDFWPIFMNFPVLFLDLTLILVFQCNIFQRLIFSPIFWFF